MLFIYLRGIILPPSAISRRHWRHRPAWGRLVNTNTGARGGSYWNEMSGAAASSQQPVARCEYDPALQWLQSRPRDWSAAATVTYHRTIDINQSRHHIPSQMHRCTQHLTPACIWHLHLGFHPPAAEALRQPGTRQPSTHQQPALWLGCSFNN